MAAHTTFAEMLDHRDYERTKVPKLIGQYRLGKTLGAGAYCKVKIATHIVTKEKFAMKILQPQAPQNWAEVEREIEILRQIQHPNIIRIHEVLWSEPGGNVHKLSREFWEVKIQAVKVYILVELAHGGELWEHISVHGHMDEKLARKLFRQMVSGLEYCHMHLICHRDLKLENILLDKQYNVKINDFGLSNFIHPGHSMHTFCGTLAYAAPEILSQQSYVGFFVDIWSLGIILFAMLTGDVPWALDDEDIKAAELRNLLAGKFRLPVGIVLSEECISLLQIMLQPNPKNRATLAQIRTHPWTNKGYTEPPARVFENYPRVTEIEESIISQIALLGLNANKARRSILNNEPCPALCLYHTLLKKQNRSKKTLPPLNDPPRSLLSPSLHSSSPPTSLSRSSELEELHLDFTKKLELSLQDDLILDPLSSFRDFAKSVGVPKMTSISAPTTPVTTPPSPLLSPTTPTGLGSGLHALTSPRSAIAVRRKLSIMERVQLDPIVHTSTTTTAGGPEGDRRDRDREKEKEREKEREKDPLFRSLFNKLRGSIKLTPLEV